VFLHLDEGVLLAVVGADELAVPGDDLGLGGALILGRYGIEGLVEDPRAAEGAARLIITEAQPVAVAIPRASASERTSPLPVTGTAPPPPRP
jgi:hypothetical protein